MFQKGFGIHKGDVASLCLLFFFSCTPVIQLIDYDLRMPAVLSTKLETWRRPNKPSRIINRIILTRATPKAVNGDVFYENSVAIRIENHYCKLDAIQVFQCCERYFY